MSILSVAKLEGIRSQGVLEKGKRQVNIRHTQAILSNRGYRDIGSTISILLYTTSNTKNHLVTHWANWLEVRNGVWPNRCTQTVTFKFYNLNAEEKEELHFVAIKTVQHWTICGHLCMNCWARAQGMWHYTQLLQHVCLLYPYLSCYSICLLSVTSLCFIMLKCTCIDFDKVFYTDLAVQNHFHQW